MKVVFTGGGTSGHVTPALAVAEKAIDRGWQAHYVGSRKGIERRLAEEAGLPYSTVPVGKLRRYFSWQNFVDPFVVIAGLAKSVFLMRRISPDAVFSKGGFVAFPVVFGAWVNRIPVVAHESDTSPGLANRLSMPFVNTLCISSEETRKHVQGKKVVFTGSPMRRALFDGSRESGVQRFGLDPNKRTVLVFGGSLGAQSINGAVREWVRNGHGHQVLHVCGAGNLDASMDSVADYQQFEYMGEEFPDALAVADAVLCRAGANSIAELVALRKPAVLVPLPAAQSRGDQIENAERFREQGFGLVLDDADLGLRTVSESIETVLRESPAFVSAMESKAPGDAAGIIADMLAEIVAP